MKFKECPVCESDDLGDRWQRGRKLRQYCCDCEWKGEPRIPEHREIKTTKKVNVKHGGLNYELYDRYGYIMESSRSYSNEDEMIEAIQKRLETGKTDKNAGPYTVIIWPEYIEVEGMIIK